MSTGILMSLIILFTIVFILFGIYFMKLLL